MFTRLLSLLEKDIRTATRDGLALYFLLSPFLFAAVMRLSLPAAEGLPMTFALGPDIDASLAAALDERAVLERYGSRDDVLRRVKASDDVPGVLAGEGGRVEVLLAGDEAAWVRALPGVLVDLEDRRQRGEPMPVLEVSSLGERRPHVRAMAAALLGFSVLLVAGLVAGMAILEERETNICKLLAVSPARFLEYAGGKLLLSSGLGLLLSALAMFLVVGSDAPWGGIALALVAAAPMGASLGLLVGAFARDQLAAVAMLKVLFFFYTTVPVVGFFVSDGPFQTALWPFPNHWAVQGLFGAMTGRLDVTVLALAAALGSVVLGATLVALRRRIGLAALGPSRRETPSAT